MSVDYGPAEFHEIPKANYSFARWRTESDLIVVHVSGGSAQGALATFADKNREASYHYIVDFDGDVWQFVREKQVAWHCGFWAWNERSFGISMAGSLKSNDDKSVEMYESMGRLIAHLSKRYDIPINRDHIKGHFEAPGCPNPGGGGKSCHSDPGKDFRWRLLLGKARKSLEEMS